MDRVSRRGRTGDGVASAISAVSSRERTVTDGKEAHGERWKGRLAHKIRTVVIEDLLESVFAIDVDHVARGIGRDVGIHGRVDRGCLVHHVATGRKRKERKIDKIIWRWLLVWMSMTS